MKRIISQILILIVIFTLSACNGGSGATSSIKPPSPPAPVSLKVSLDPNDGGISNNESNVSLSPKIIIAFSQTMNPTTVNANNVDLVVQGSESPVTIDNITASADNTLFYFTPQETLEKLTTYQIALKDNIKTATNAPIPDTTFSFTTQDTVIPTVAILSPNNNESGISITPSIQIQFSEAVNNVSTSSITLHQGSATGATVNLNSISAGADNTYTFSPAENLNSFTNYYLVISDAITDLAGNQLVTTVFNFSTKDTTIPSVSLIMPSNNASNVGLNPNIQIQFSQAVQNVSNKTISLHQGTTFGPIVEISTINQDAANIYAFYPIESLQQNTPYYIVLSPDITNLAGNSLVATIFDFTTQVNSVISIVSPNTPIIAGVGSSQNVTVQFTTNFASASNLNISSNLADLNNNYPGWSSASQIFNCSLVNNNNNCSLSLTFTPTNQNESGVLVLNYSYIDGSDTLQTGVINLSYSTLTHAYISNPQQSSIASCTINTDGSFSNCTTLTDPSFVIPVGIAVNNGKIYISNYAANTISICTINPDYSFSGCTVANITSGYITSPRGISIESNTLYIANKGNTASNASVSCALDSNGLPTSCANLAIGSAPNDILINQDILYISNLNGSISYCPLNELSSCDTAASTIFSNDPYGISFNNNFAYVTEFGDNAISSDIQLCTLTSSGDITNCNITSSGYTGATSTNIINNNYIDVLDHWAGKIYACTLNADGSFADKDGCKDVTDPAITSPELMWIGNPLAP